MVADLPEHKCGKVLDYCTFQDTKIFFCIFCKKVVSAAKESEIKITITKTDAEMNEYDEQNLKDWA